MAQYTALARAAAACIGLVGLLCFFVCVGGFLGPEGGLAGRASVAAFAAGPSFDLSVGSEGVLPCEFVVHVSAFVTSGSAILLSNVDDATESLTASVVEYRQIVHRWNSSANSVRTSH